MTPPLNPPKNPHLLGQTVRHNNQVWMWYPKQQKWHPLKQQKSLQTSNAMSYSYKPNRPSPSVSATTCPVGFKMTGNDGNTWQVQANSAGVQRWVRYYGNSPVSQPMKPPVTYKYDVGDIVEVVRPGSGVGSEHVGQKVTIIEKGLYGFSDNPGYKVDPLIGNSASGSFNGMIGEDSFDIVQPRIIFQQHTKPLKMARTKSITKKTTQEVRNIETSLINKEEVFKMLALAEATGLPLLLVGEPGVNSK